MGVVCADVSLVNLAHSDEYEGGRGRLCCHDKDGNVIAHKNTI